MKLNWGTGLAIGMIAFISFIMYFVITMLTSPGFDHDLVVEDYYGAELHYQQDINAESNALELKDKLTFTRKGNSLFINLPQEIELSKLEGNIAMYRPSNKALDFQVSLNNLQDHKLEIPTENIVKGRWNVIVNWNYLGKDFLFKKEINY